MGCNSSREGGGGDVAMVEQTQAQLAQAVEANQKAQSELQQAQERRDALEQELAELRSRVEAAESDARDAKQSNEQVVEGKKKKKKVKGEEDKKLAVLQQALKDMEDAKAKEVQDLQQKLKEQQQINIVAASTPTKKVSAPVQTFPAGSADENVEKLRKELEVEKKLTADLRADAMRKTKEALANAAAGSSNGNKSGALVVVEATEQQRMNVRKQKLRKR
jgi:hypothetical protein